MQEQQGWWGHHHQGVSRQSRDGRGSRSSRDACQRRGRVQQQQGRWGDPGGGKKEVKQEQPEEKTELGFGDLCRFYHRTMRAEKDDYTSHNVSQGARSRGETHCCYIYPSDCLEYD